MHTNSVIGTIHKKKAILYVVIIQAVALMVLAGGWGAGRAAAAETPLESFTLWDARAPARECQLRGAVSEERAPDGSGLRIRFEPIDWPQIDFQAAAGPWNWTGWEGIRVTVRNLESRTCRVGLRVDNPGADGRNLSNTRSISLGPNQSATLTLQFRTPETDSLWGMRGLPALPWLADGTAIDLKQVSAFQIFMHRPKDAHRLVIGPVALFRRTGGTHPAAMPFVDRFGQYRHAEWPGKLTDPEQWKIWEAEEKARQAAEPEPPGRDRFGGWADGPRLNATGRFRTEKWQDKWWLVTPDGTLFFSMGVDCVRLGDYTFVEKREPWFEWLPGNTDPEAAFYSRASGVHSHAEPIAGAGRTFDFYACNLWRRYGEGWRDRWLDSAGARLKHWGFNTIANWSDLTVARRHGIPYVISTSLGGAPVIEGATGYWGKMHDVYHPKFVELVDERISQVTREHADQPLCLGLFVDNELSWEGVKDGVLASPAGQPAREELIRVLREKYGSLEALNAAWETAFTDWNALARPKRPNKACRADLESFLLAFARTYFRIIREAVDRHVPGMLYLGCRFAWVEDAAVRAAAEYADVVSFNIYQKTPMLPRIMEEIDKPVIIGEFHFGALDRGMFHTGLVAASSQEERAALYEAYLREAALNPKIVGTHWFQFLDEPVTGRWYDGENYNIGLISVVDQPYPELTEAARRIHGMLYPLRAGQSAENKP